MSKNKPGLLATLRGRNVAVNVSADFSLDVIDRTGSPICRTSKTVVPMVNIGGRSIPFHQAGRRQVAPFERNGRVGYRFELSQFPGTDVPLTLILALDPERDELHVEVEPMGGADDVRAIDALYRLEKPVAAGGYLVLSHGSGYLIDAQSNQELPGSFDTSGIIGGRWTLPMFGVVYGDWSVMAVVDTWWDCGVRADHVPGRESALQFDWLPSLGRLGYLRRMSLRFARNLDYVGMARLYRERAKTEGLVCTLEEKARQLPAVRQYTENVLFRWPAWRPSDRDAVLADVRRLRAMGLGLNFFFPKWSSSGYHPDRDTATTADANWQAFLHEMPIPGGWPELNKFAGELKECGCLIQGFICPRTQKPHGPMFDEARWPTDEQGKRIEDLSTHDMMDRMNRVLDFIGTKGFKLDVMYYDGLSDYDLLPEDFSPTHRVTRRQTIEAQNAVFAETRRRGIVPGGEVARFWCMKDCDYFFFTDWARDRLTNVPSQHSPGPAGRPVPLYQLVFHDCYIAGFSGGGYSLYTPGYDWWPDRTPRLYELLFAAAPAHNWLSDGYVPVKDWTTKKAENRWAWLKRWNDWYRAVATSAMTNHTFLSPEGQIQRIEFANGVAAEFDLNRNLCRVTGVPGFTGEWEPPAEPFTD